MIEKWLGELFIRVPGVKVMVIMRANVLDNYISWRMAIAPKSLICRFPNTVDMFFLLEPKKILNLPSKIFAALRAARFSMQVSFFSIQIVKKNVLKIAPPAPEFLICELLRRSKPAFSPFPPEASGLPNISSF